MLVIEIFVFLKVSIESGKKEISFIICYYYLEQHKYLTYRLLKVFSYAAKHLKKKVKECIGRKNILQTRKMSQCNLYHNNNNNSNDN